MVHGPAAARGVESSDPCYLSSKLLAVSCNARLEGLVRRLHALAMVEDRLASIAPSLLLTKAPATSLAHSSPFGAASRTPASISTPGREP